MKKTKTSFSSLAMSTHAEQALPWLCANDKVSLKELHHKGYDFYLRRLKPGVDLFTPCFLNRN